MSAFTTLEELKAWLQLANTANDDLLGKMIPRCSDAIEGYLNRNIAQADYVDIIDGNGGTRIMFAQFPVTAVTSLYIDGRQVLASTGPSVQGFTFNEISLTLRGYRFTRGQSNVEVSYTAGYAQTPPDIQEACIQWIAYQFKARDRIGHVSKTIGPETVTFLTSDMPAVVKTILANYKKVVPT